MNIMGSMPSSPNGKRSLHKKCLISQTFLNGGQCCMIRTTPAGFQEAPRASPPQLSMGPFRSVPTTQLFALLRG
jgi:hypothetical protein